MRRAGILLSFGAILLIAGGIWLTQEYKLASKRILEDQGNPEGVRLNIYCQDAEPVICAALRKNAAEDGSFYLTGSASAFREPEISIFVDGISGTEKQTTQLRYKIWYGHPFSGRELYSGSSSTITELSRMGSAIMLTEVILERLKRLRGEDNASD